MIKFDDVLKYAEKVLNKEDLDKFKVMESKNDPNQRYIVETYLKESEDSALHSAYTDDCDLVIFSHYRFAKDFSEIYDEYKEEKYAIGT